MAEDSAASSSAVPQPLAKPSTDTAVDSPTLSEPASGPVMSGALQDADIKPSLAESRASAGSTSNGDSAPEANSTMVDVPLAETQTTAESTGDADPLPLTAAHTSAAESTAGGNMPETNGTPASLKKQSNGKRKSTGGIPEHKTKKLNKKKSASKITNLDAEPGQFYFARLKSYPPWPSVICDETMLPQSLLTTRPVTTKQSDGTYKEAYADGGKRAYERTFPIMFLHTNEFAWIPNTDLTLLDPEECKEVSEKSKTKSLIAAYKVASENHDLEYFQNMLRDHAAAMQEDQELREQRETEKAAKIERKKRKSEAAADEDVEMEDDDAGDSEIKKSSKKRKKDVNSDEDEKPAKTPKTATKLKLTTPKAPSTGEKKSKDSEKKSKPKADKKKKAGSEEETDTLKEPEKIVVDPAEAKKQREKEILYLRHKLQKGFLTRDQVPQEAEMPTMANYIKRLEDHVDLEVSIIRTTKINKVLKALLKLDSIPRDEEFKFKERSIKLLEKWNKLLGSEEKEVATADMKSASKGDNTPPAAEEGSKEEMPVTNGVHTKTDEDEEAKEIKEDVIPGPEPKVPHVSEAALNNSTALPINVAKAGDGDVEAEPDVEAAAPKLTKEEVHDKIAGVTTEPATEAAKAAEEPVDTSEGRGTNA